MTGQKPFRSLIAVLGAAVAGLAAYATFVISGMVSGSYPFAGLILLAVVAGVFWATLRSGNRDFAIGLAGGYGLLTLMSAGQCTLLLELPSGDGPLLFGFFIYPIVIAVAFVAALIHTIVRRRRQKGDQT